jgi:hypothetical protein
MGGPFLTAVGAFRRRYSSKVANGSPPWRLLGPPLWGRLPQSIRRKRHKNINEFKSAKCTIADGFRYRQGNGRRTGQRPFRVKRRPDRTTQTKESQFRGRSATSLPWHGRKAAQASVSLGRTAPARRWLLQIPRRPPGMVDTAKMAPIFSLGFCSQRRARVFPSPFPTRSECLLTGQKSIAGL